MGGAGGASMELSGSAHPSPLMRSIRRHGRTVKPRSHYEPYRPVPERSDVSAASSAPGQNVRPLRTVEPRRAALGSSARRSIVVDCGMANPTLRTKLMCSFKGRLALARMDAAKEHPLEHDPWFAPTSQLSGRVDGDRELVTSQECMDALGVPQGDRDVGAFRRLTKLMRAHGWEAVRIKPDGRQVRGYQRALPAPRPDLETAARELLAEWRHDPAR
jgi:hypothetical protein